MEFSPLNATFASLLAFLIVATSVFDRFEAETPILKKIAKWSIVSIASLWLSTVVGYWAAAAPIAAGLIGLSVHVGWCLMNRIHPLTAEPRRRYYELRGWRWPD